MVDELHVARVVEVLHAERTLDRVECGLRRRHGLVLLVVEVVGARELGLVLALGRLAGRGLAAQIAHDPREVVVGARRRLRLAGDDQRRPGLVDQDRVDLVHDRVRVAALHDVVERHRHVVAEVVEAELGVGAVRDVGLVGRLAKVERHQVLDEADGHAEALEDATVPFGVALGEVVVHGHEVDPGRRERVQVQRRRGDERLALTGLHLGDVALVEDDAAHHLDVEHPLLRLPPARLPHGGERLEQQLVERLSVREPLPELDRLGTQLLVGERLEVGLERRDVLGLLLEPLQAPPLAEAKDLLELAEFRRGHVTESVPGGPQALTDSSHNTSTLRRMPRCHAPLRLLVPLGCALALVAVGSAAALQKPGRTIVRNGPGAARRSQPWRRLRSRSPARRSTATTSSSGTSTRRARGASARPGACTNLGSTGAGISSLGVSGNRVVWVRYNGGNLRDWQLMTATTTQKTPKQLRFVEQDVDLPAPIVVGDSTAGLGIPYAAGKEVVLLGTNGVAVFKRTEPARIVAVSAGQRPRGSRRCGAARDR